MIDPSRHHSPTLAVLFAARHATGLLVLVAVIATAPALVPRDASRGVFTGGTLTLIGTARSWASLLHQHRVRVGLDVAPDVAARLLEGGAAVVMPLNARDTRLDGRVVGVADHVDLATRRVAVEIEVDDASSVLTRGASVEVELELPR